MLAFLPPVVPAIRPLPSLADTFHQRSSTSFQRMAPSPTRWPEMVRRPWGKRPCRDYLAVLRAQEPKPVAKGVIECHPLRHLRWTLPPTPPTVGAVRDVRTALPAGDDFDRVNSTTHVFAAVGVDWRRVFALALRLEGGVEAEVVEAITYGEEWLVKDARSLEIVAANACLNQRCLVRRVDGPGGVLLDLSRAAPILRRAGVVEQHFSGEARSDPFVRDGTLLRALPTEIACTRDLEAPVWPKAFHFANVISTAGDTDERFGVVPLRRLADGRWASGSRHRTTAALLTGMPFPCRKIRE